MSRIRSAGCSLTAPLAADGGSVLPRPAPVYPQSAGFVFDPAGKVVVSVYSSGAIGRLVPDDVVGLVRSLREHSPAVTA